MPELSNSASTTFHRAITGAVMLSAAAFGSTTAQGSDFTPVQCRLIAAVGVDVAKSIGPNKLSAEFKQSFRDFLGANLTCDGPKDILTPRGKDIDAFNVIRSVLLAPPAKISLEKAGLRSVDPVVAARRPLDGKRSELSPIPAAKAD